MPTFEVDLPIGLLGDIHRFAEYQETDVDSFILWAVAEKVGELKGAIIDKALNTEINTSETPIQRIPTIKNVTPLDDFVLQIEMEGGLAGIFDMKPLIRREGVFKVLENLETFKTVKIAENGDYILWESDLADNEVTIGADTIYAKIWRTER
jgi:hypothetical protein